MRGQIEEHSLVEQLVAHAPVAALLEDTASSIPFTQEADLRQNSRRLRHEGELTVPFLFRRHGRASRSGLLALPGGKLQGHAQARRHVLDLQRAANRLSDLGADRQPQPMPAFIGTHAA